MKSVLSNIFYASPVLFSLLFAVLAVVEKSRFWTACLIASLVEFFVVGYILKMVTAKTNTASLRPIYRGSPGPATRERNGMPSAHTSNAVFCIILVAYYMLSCKGGVSAVVAMVVSVAIVCGVAWQRVHTKMHSKKQVAIGSMVGIIESFVFLGLYKLCERRVCPVG